MEVLGAIDDEDELNLMQLARMAGMVTQMSEGEAVGLLQELMAVKEGEDHDATQMKRILGVFVFSRLCEVNGPEAMRMVAEGELGVTMGSQTDEMLAMGMNAWVAADPEGARRWFDGVLGEVDALALDGGMEEDMKNATGVMKLLQEKDLMDAYLRGMAKHDAEALTKSVESLRHEQVREAMEAEILEAVVETETTADGMVALLQQYEGAEGTDARMAAIRKLSELDNARAAKWLEGRAPSAERDHLVTRVADDMMKKDPAAGAAWYMDQELHDADREADRLQRITWQWGRADYEEASQWLERQPDGTARDGAESGMAQMAAGRQEWAESMAWLDGISNEKIQADAMQRILRSGWNPTEKVMNAELLEAAEAAGFGEQAREYGAGK